VSSFGITNGRLPARKRSQGRLEVRLDATLKSHSWTRSAILENISRSGAMVTVESAPPKGTEVVLEWHSNQAFGRVAWANETRCAVRFESPVSALVLQSTLSLDQVAHVPDGLDCNGAAAKAWFDGAGRFGFD
jgi:hypothetical protein